MCCVRLSLDLSAPYLPLFLVSGRGIPVSIIFQIGTGGVVDGARPFDFPFSPADADEPLE